MRSQPKHHPRLIKRYGNRKLYDVQTSRYITLDGIRALVQAGEEVRVVDNDTTEDLTGVTFAQIIYEAERRGNGALSLPLLRWLIERGDDAMRDFRRGVDRGREAIATVRAAAEKRVQTFVRMEAHDSRSLLGDLLETPQRHLEDLQQRIDKQVRESVDRVASHPTIQGELKRVERGLREIEKRLGAITKNASAVRRPVRARPRRAAKGRPQRPDRETSDRR